MEQNNEEDNWTDDNAIYLYDDFVDYVIFSLD